MMNWFKWHRLLAIIIAPQLLLWLLSGIWFSTVDADLASGNSKRISPSQSPASAALTLPQLLRQHPLAAITEAKLVSRLGQPYYLIDHDLGSTLFDAATGAVTTLTAEQITAIAASSYGGDGTLSAAILTNDDSDGFNAGLWRVNSSDKLSTRIYVSPSGEVIGHHNRYRTLNQWAFAAHFIDYPNGSSFNHLLIWVAAVIAVAFAGSGVMVLIAKLRRGMLHRSHLITAVDSDGITIASWRCRPGQTVLAQHSALLGRCQGAGECGQCGIKVDGAPHLACQYFPDAATQIVLNRRQLRQLPRQP